MCCSASGVVIAGVNKNRAVSLGAQKAITKNKGQVCCVCHLCSNKENRTLTGAETLECASRNRCQPNLALSLSHEG